MDEFLHGLQCPGDVSVTLGAVRLILTFPHEPDLTDMTQEHPKNPLHGITLAMMLEQLVAQFGWEEMGRAIPIRCFTHDPSLKSSLTFLRKTPWARAKVEAFYIDRLDEIGSSASQPDNGDGSV